MNVFKTTPMRIQTPKINLYIWDKQHFSLKTNISETTDYNCDFKYEET